MGTQERKQRERSERELRFIKAARDLIATDGILNLQMAKLADACDYATGTLYQHFSSKEDLLVAVAADGIEPNLRLFERASAWQECSRHRLFALSVVDTVCTDRCPVQAKLIQYVFTEAVWENASEARRQQLTEAVQRFAPHVEQIVVDAIKAGDVAPGGLKPLELSLGPWSLIKGMHALTHTRGLLDSIGVGQPQPLLYRQIQVYLNGMNWRPHFDVDDAAALQQLVERIYTEVIDHEV